MFLEDKGSNREKCGIFQGNWRNAHPLPYYILYIGRERTIFHEGEDLTQVREKIIAEGKTF